MKKQSDLEGKLLFELPPNFDILDEHFTIDKDSIVVTYHPNVYASGPIPHDVLEHEGVHLKQQGEIGVEKWWERYLEDVEFRMEQELEAYRFQWQWLSQNVRDRNMLARHMNRIASDLSGPMYGNMIGYQDAVNKIRGV